MSLVKRYKYSLSLLEVHTNGISLLVSLSVVIHTNMILNLTNLLRGYVTGSVRVALCCSMGYPEGSQLHCSVIQ